LGKRNRSGVIQLEEEMNPIEPEMLGQWFESYSARLALYGRQWLDADEAEDVVQDTFIRLMRQKSSPDNVKAWLFCAVRNEAISRWRWNRRRQNHRDEVEQLQADWFERDAKDPMDMESAQKALTTLPEDLREVVLLRIWGQMTLKEIGGILAQPVSTIFNKYQSAMELLRKKMEKTCPTNLN
jgi:RNA polymerase sigma-70 factor (ECF subfamily)